MCEAILLQSIFSQDGLTALRFASQNGYVKCVIELTNAGAAVDVKDKVCGVYKSIHSIRVVYVYLHYKLLAYTWMWHSLQVVAC